MRFSQVLVRWLLNEKGTSHISEALQNVVIIALMGFSNFGYGTGVISGAAPIMKDALNLSVLELTCIVTSTIIFAAVGAGFGGPLSDKYGRKRIILISGIISCIATIGCALTLNILMLIGARALLGIGIGLNFTVIPMYVAETVPKDQRGRIVDLSDFSVVSGQLLSGIINGFTSTFISNDNLAWRLAIFLGILPPSILVLIIFLFDTSVESPRWLISKSLIFQAKDTLALLRLDEHFPKESLSTQQYSQKEGASSSEDDQEDNSSPQLEEKFLLIANEIESIQKAISSISSNSTQRHESNSTYFRAQVDEHAQIDHHHHHHEEDVQEIEHHHHHEEEEKEREEKDQNKKITLVKRMSTLRVQRALWLGIGIQILTQLSGINAAMYYGADICIDAGLPQETSIWLACGLTFAQLIGVKISLSTVDIKGRRFTLLRSLLCVIPCLLLLGIAFLLDSSLAVLPLIGYLIAFGSGLSGVGYVILSEIFPLDVRGTCVAIGSVSFWIANSIVAFNFPIVSATIGPEFCFFFFSFISICGFFVLFSYLPETAHKSLEDIDSFFIGEEYPKKNWYYRGFYGIVDDENDQIHAKESRIVVQSSASGPLFASLQLILSAAVYCGSKIANIKPPSLCFPSSNNLQHSSSSHVTIQQNEDDDDSVAADFV